MATTKRQVLLVVDGLRPDLVDEDTTPVIAGLRSAGVEVAAAHAVAPPVTRINGAAIVTGRGPGGNGIVGNEMYRPSLTEGRAFSTADGANLQRLARVAGTVLDCPSLGAVLHSHGRLLVTVGSGSSGSALLMNPEAARGAGVMINTDQPREGLPLAVPTSVERDLHARFGPPPRKRPDADYTPTLAYATSVVCDYVLPVLDPDVLVFWLTEPDHSQHQFGLDSPEASVARRAADHAVGRVLAALDGLGPGSTSDVMVISDHGFSTVSGKVDVEGELVDAGLKASRESGDVVVANSGCALFYVRDRDQAHIRALVEFLHRRPWAEAVFTAAVPPGTGRPPATVDPDESGLGWVAGTFADTLLGSIGNPREPDVVVSLPWSGRRSTNGIHGDSVVVTRGDSPASRGQHGNLSPFDLRSTMICHGPSFRAGARSLVPAGNLDVMPTLLALAGIGVPVLDGRVMTEVLADGGPTPSVATATKRVAVPESDYRAAVEVAYVAGRRYLARAWRER